MTQTERVMQYMKDFGSISTHEAYTELGITRLASRIHDLVRSGVDLKRENVSGLNRYGEKIHYTRYSLA